MNKIFDIGIEHEFFLKKDNIIFNASKELEKIFGFSIDQNTSGGAIQIDNSLSLRTDGTCCELQKFIPVDKFCQESLDYFEVFNKFKLLKKFDRAFHPYIENGLKGPNKPYGPIYTFDSPGHVYASGKWTRNAYTGQMLESKKEDTNKEVTFRTAGIHVHFSLANNIAFWGWDAKKREDLNHLIFKTGSYEHTDNLIKIFDECYHFVYERNFDKIKDELVDLREKFYQNKGVYRIKWDTITQNPSLEYRQLASNQSYDLYEFILLCQCRAYEYIKKTFLTKA